MKPLLATPILALALSAEALAQCPNNDSFGNTEPSTAIQLNSGFDYLQNFSIVGVAPASPASHPGHDFFRFTLAAGRTATFEVDYNFSETALYIQVHPLALTGSLAGTNPNGQTANLTFTNTGATTDFYLRVASGAAFQGCGNYNLRSLIDECPGDDFFEHNDDCAAAYALFGPVESNPSLQALASIDNDDDWFSFVVLDGESLDVSMDFEHARADLDLQFFDITGGNCGGAAIGTSQSVSDMESLSYSNSSGSTKTIGARVYFYDSAAGNSCNDYRLDYHVTPAPVDDIYEPNDTICTATSAVGIGYYEDLIVYEADSDFYEFTVLQGDYLNMTVDFLHADGDIDLRLHELSGGCMSAVVVDSSGSTSNTEVVTAVGTSPGGTQYVLEVFYYPSDDGVNDYTLSISRGTLGSPGGTYCLGEINSLGLRGVTSATGSPSVSMNDMVVAASDLPQNSFGFFIASPDFGFIPNAGGGVGNLCMLGQIGRYVGPGQIMSSGSSGSMSLPIDWITMPNPTGPVSAQAGETWHFQAWHRDTSPQGPTSNFSGGMRVRVEP